MNYDTIILEMLSRIQALEQKVELLTEQMGGAPTTQVEKITTPVIQRYIERMKSEAAEVGEEYLQVKANDIHRALHLKSRFPMVCNAMRKCMREGDVVIHETPSGYSSTLEIRYCLERMDSEEEEF